MEFLDKHIEDDGAFGTVDVQIAPIGEFNGSNAKGEPVPEVFTQETLQELADKMNAKDEECLVDVDHKSTKNGNEKDTRAAGWLSNFYTTVKGLFAKLKFTKHGRELVDSREYRHLSPVFALSKSGEPLDMHSAGITNRPALKMEPILNTNPSIIEESEDILTMTHDELVELIKETITAMNSKPDDVADVVEDEKTEPTVEEPKEEKTEEKEEVENSCGEDEKEEVKNEEVTEEKEEEKEEEKKEEIKKDPEIIDEEVLNSAPNPSTDISTEPWRDLHGKAFFDYLKKHPECK